MKNTLIVAFGISLFGSIAIFRGIALGQDISKSYLIAGVVLSLGLGLILFYLKKQGKTKRMSSDNETE